MKEEDYRNMIDNFRISETYPFQKLDFARR